MQQVAHPHPGDSTAAPSNVSYRLGKLKDLDLLNGDWLDAGCATGGYTEALVIWGANRATGIDPDPIRIAEAKSKKSSNTDFYSFTDTFPFPDNSFDRVLLNEVLEHVPDEAATLCEIRRVLRPNGVLVVMSPNRWFPFEGHGMHIWGRDIGFPIPFLPWLPSRIATRFMAARNYWPHELRNIVTDAGFNIRLLDYVMPVFEVYPWLPPRVITLYRKLVPFIEKTPFRKFGVSTLIVATPNLMRGKPRRFF